MANPSLGIALRQLRGLMQTHTAEAVSDGQLLERFTTRGEETAFAALLNRHGPMVLGVGRRVLGQVEDAEDILQATFLLLARKAGSIRRGEKVSGWLHAVALRLAVKVKGQKIMRHRRETRAATRHPAEPGLDGAWRELLAALDEELERLPARYRVPLVLCYLEGKTQEEARRQLGWPLGTVRSRLARARGLLRARLARRGLSLSSSLLGTVLVANSAGAALPGLLFQATLRAGLRCAAGGAVSGVSAQAVALVKAGLHTMSVTKMKTGAILFLLFGLVSTGAAVLARSAPDAKHTAAASTAGRVQPAGPPRQAGQPDHGPKPLAKPGPQADRPAAQQMTLTGRVLTPDGKPAARARVAVIALSTRPLKPREEWVDLEQVLGTSRADGQGRFRLAVRRTSSRTFSSLELMAAAPGYGLGWQNLHPDTTRLDHVIRLRPEQVVRGRLIDLQGKPAPGVRLELAYVGSDKPTDYDNRQIALWKTHPGLAAWPGPVTTDAGGRFVLGGLGRNLLFGLRARDDRFALQDLHRIPTGDGKQTREVTLLLEPARIVEGRVTFADTGKPVKDARVTVRCYTRRINRPTFEYGEVTYWADAKGRFRVNTYPGNHILVTANAPAGSPYLAVQKELAWPKGLVREQVSLALARNLALTNGVLVHGRVTEKPSGKPVAGVGLTFWRGTEVIASAETGADGRFRLKVLPGPGALLFRSRARDYIQQAVYREPGSRRFTLSPPVRQFEQNWNVDAFREVDLKPGVELLEVKVVLRLGQTVHGRLVGPDGRAVGTVRMLCPVASASALTELTPVELRAGRFMLTGCDPELTYPALFLDAKHQWRAVAPIAGKQADGRPLTVRLAPCGTAVVRLRNGTGQPLNNYRPNRYGFQILVPAAFPTNTQARGQKLPASARLFQVSFDRRHYSYPDSLQTDAQGLLTLPALIPGATYQLWERGTITEFKVASGQTLKLADIRLP